MPRSHLFCLCLLAALLTACKNESSFTSINPYLTGRILSLLEQREIEYRFGRDGVIRYPADKQAEFEQVHRDALKPTARQVAVVIKSTQAQTITSQFDDIGIAYLRKDLGYFVLLTWNMPTAFEPEPPASPQPVDDGSFEIKL